MDQPNIFLIVFDTLRKDTLFQNIAQLPNFQNLLKISTVYNNAISPASWTFPSHASLFSGQYPSEHGLRTRFSLEEMLDGITSFRAKERTIPKILAHQGYNTVSITANQIIGEGTAFGEIFNDVRSVGPLRYRFEIRQEIRKIAGLGAPNMFVPGSINSISKLLRDSGLLNSAKIVRLALEREFHLKMTGFPVSKGAADVTKELGSLKLKEPHFVFMNFIEMHEPYHSFMNFEVLEGFFLRGMLTGDFSNRKHFDRILNKLKKDTVDEIKVLDAYLGKVVHQLKLWGIFEDSVLIVTSDHGQSFGEDNYVGHGYMLNDPLVSVPCFIKTPKNVHLIDNRYVSTMDLFGFMEACKDGDYLQFPERDYIFSEEFGLNQVEWNRRVGDLSGQYFPEVRKRVWAQTGENLTVNGSRGLLESVSLRKDTSEGSSRNEVLSSLLQELELFVGSDKFILPAL